MGATPKCAANLRWKVRRDIWQASAMSSTDQRADSRASIDPNGYPIEITWQLRPFSGEDAQDAQNTLEAAMALEEGGFDSIEPVWRAKGAALGGPAQDKAAIYVLDVPEFKALLEAAEASPGYATQPADNGYVRIVGNPGLRFQRKELGFKPAVWYGALTGGLNGRIERFDMDVLAIEPLEQA